MSYSRAQLEQLWQQAGGNPQAAPMAAGVALAESSGNPDAENVNTNGSTDRGLWQINSVHGAQSTFDPLANARAAVSISNNGTNWRPWSTAWSDGLGGTRGGTYLGPGSPALVAAGSSAGGASVDTAGLPLPGPGGVLGWLTGGGSLVGGALGKSAASAIVKPVLQFALYGMEAMFGAFLIILGAAVLAANVLKDHPEVAAAIPGAGEVAGAASAAKVVARESGDTRRGRGQAAVHRRLPRSREAQGRADDAMAADNAKAAARNARSTGSHPGIGRHRTSRTGRRAPAPAASREETGF